MGSSWKNMVVAGVIVVIGVGGILIKFEKLPGGIGGKLSGLGIPLGGGAKVEKEQRPPTWSDLLRLSGLSGAPARRLAIVNNQTLGVGETARVEVEGEKIKVTCHEIREQSVVLQVEGAGDPFEIFLRDEAGVATNQPPALSALAARVRPSGPVATSAPNASLPVALDGEQVRALAARIPTNGVVELEKVVDSLNAAPSGERSPGMP